MSDHFLNYIEIEKFKCFSNFKAEGFKRVNLIGGKNNVGKTAFMEACYVNVCSDTMTNLMGTFIGIKFMRENINLIGKDPDLHQLLDSTGYYTAHSNVNSQSYFIKKENVKKEYHLRIGDKIDDVINARAISISDTKQNFLGEDHIVFIDNFGFTNENLTDIYQHIQKQDKEYDLNNCIRDFDNNIENFKVIGDKPQCKVNGEYRDITEFGDGLKHYISIICGLYACENGYLFIDEIGNGIHYTQHDRLWELILTLSKKTNCQVFAITHSKEMLESFARVAKKLDEQEISYTILVKNKQQEIKTISLDYDAILDSLLDQGHEVR